MTLTTAWDVRPRQGSAVSAICSNFTRQSKHASYMIAVMLAGRWKLLWIFVDENHMSGPQTRPPHKAEAFGIKDVFRSHFKTDLFTISYPCTWLCIIGVDRVWPASQILPATSLDQARSGSSVLTLNLACVLLPNQPKDGWLFSSHAGLAAHW